jgi:DNA-binding SARP family transcriptional activator
VALRIDIEIDIDILGTVSVTVNGGQRELRANKLRAMLAVLALDAGRAVSFVDLADELWAGGQLGNARNALQAHATRLRKVLDTPGAKGTVLRAVRNGYLLDVPSESVDGNRFLRLADQGSAVLRADPRRALELFQSALRLWRGPALLDAGDGLRCGGAAALFEERRLTLWEDLVNARLAIGEEREAVAELRQLVAQYPLRERFCEQLMLALYRSGRQGDALELFHRTRQWLDRELGLRPGVPLQRRHAEILAHDPVLSQPAAL